MDPGTGFSALIPAAGKGQRLGRGPKAFVRLGARTLIQHVVDAFRPHAAEILVAVPGDQLEEAAALLPGVQVLAGENTRQGTVATLLSQAHNDIVLIHDAARPFLSGNVIQRTTEAATERGAATAAVPIFDTVIDIERNQTINRSRFRAVQTPQGFHRDLLLRAHRQASDHGYRATDDADLVRALGLPVALVEGNPLLFKVTTPEDLLLARALAQSGTSEQP
ncbi:MAG: 2-C-methyl-D-erythritol 4-phosphate cytidylyltransferase [Truepera sp.]|nr:2-C-methyl-D-erythritol 4-phosphate cytidylyltransferase [Truepera sp.]